MPEPFSRPISPVEWTYLAHPPGLETVLQVFVEGTGTLDPETVRAAVARAGDACPGSRLTRRGGRWVDIGVPPAVRVSDGDALDRTTFAGLDALQQPLRGRAGSPTCEVVLLTGERPGLLFRAFHAVMDGRGVFLWMAEVFRALRGEAPRPAVSPELEIDLVRRFRRTGPRPQPVPVPASPLSRPAGLRGRGQVFRRRTVDGNHPALIAKIAVALTELCDLPTGTFLVPSDLRRYDPALRSTGNLVLGVRLDLPAGTTWQQAQETLLRSLARDEDLEGIPDVAMMERVRRLPLPALRGFMATSDTLIARRGRAQGHFVLTHLGRPDLADYSGPTFTAESIYEAPARGYFVSPSLAITELDGRTELVLRADGGPDAGRRADETMDALVDRLSPAGSRIAGGPPADAGTDTLTGRFARQVERFGDRVALSTPAETVTYAELDRRADVVAAELLGRGIGAGDVVGLLGDRSVATLAGLWGVLKAGAAYLPLDPRRPDAGLRDVLADAGARVSLVDAAQADRDLGGDVIWLAALPTGGAAPAPAAARPDDLAYVIYTSGSTGRPKGVEIEHRAVVHYAAWAGRAFGVDEHTCFPLFTSLAFDLPGTALFPTLLAGGRLELVREEPDHVVLTRMLTGRGVTAIKLTPSHLDLIDRLGLTAAGIRLAVLGGEALTPAALAAARRVFGPDCRIVNHYGPTEATVGCVFHDCGGDGYDGVVPIGRPAPGTVVHLLDETRVRVPAGEAGEMYLTGPQLARGYRGHPELDRDAFVRLADGGRAYRTGDLARRLPSGELVYAGRRDHQVKILGHRVEPGEVELALQRHPAVARAVVVARPPTGPGARLYAYVQLTGPASGDELDAFLAGTLPPYLRPAAIQAVEEFPRTANGKVDRSALPDPSGRAVPADAPAPDDDEPVDDTVAARWAAALGTAPDRLAASSDFHRLGGDSIALLALIAGIAREELDPPAAEAFMAGIGPILVHPTLGAMSDAVRSARGAEPVEVP
ncbi:non-ribosomal peptide synthetase [Dactylosporangium sp. CA-092794]|uniref:non-ribosomal peptide synthetase n=1 Tax=Dactylosporangium sp. CA-092794 TaxID=3239929 RepID=UPI003D8F090E